MSEVIAKITRLIIVKPDPNKPLTVGDVELVNVFASIEIGDEILTAIIMVNNFHTSDIGVTTFTFEMGTLMQVSIEVMFSDSNVVKTSFSPLDASVFTFSTFEPIQVKLVGTSLEFGTQGSPTQVSYPGNTIDIVPVNTITFELNYTNIDSQ